MSAAGTSPPDLGRLRRVFERGMSALKYPTQRKYPTWQGVGHGGFVGCILCWGVGVSGLYVWL